MRGGEGRQKTLALHAQGNEVAKEMGREECVVVGAGDG